MLPLRSAVVVLLTLAACTGSVTPPTCNDGEVLDASGVCVKQGCGAGLHDGGDGTCVAAGSCSSGFHDDGSGTCVAQGCATGFHDDGAGKCVQADCAAGFHDDGAGKCVAEGCATAFHDDGAGKCAAVGTCASGFHDDGTGTCVAQGCATGFHDDGTGKCVASGCATGFHDGGAGACVAAGTCSSGFHDDGAGTCVQADCATGFHDDGAGKCVASGCATGFQDGGAGACVAVGSCSSGFHDDGAGTCVAQGCATGFHDGGDGKCMSAGTCATGFHDGGAGACVALTACSSGYHADGAGGCAALGVCAGGFHDGGAGDCVANGACSTGFHDDGTGACLAVGCATGFHDDGTGKCVASGCATGFHDDGVGRCVASGCASGYHDDGTGKCVASGCATGFHDGGAGACVATGTCSAGFHNGGGGTCVAANTCSTGFHDGGGGACVENGTCSAGFHDDGVGKCVASGCATGYHDGGGGKCVLAGTCATGFHDDGKGACVASGCASGYHDGGDGKCVVVGTCSPTGHDDGVGNCIPQFGTCATGYHDAGDGTACWANGTGCMTGYHNGGPANTCAPLDACVTGYHTDLAGTCIPTVVCTGGEHDDGTGKCILTGCAVGYHDSGGGTCAGSGLCLKGFHLTASGACEVDLVQVVVGSEHACALTSVGGVKCWGRNQYGQLGDGSTTLRTLPVDVAGLASGVKALAAGAQHTCAVMGTGTAKCWGYNFYSQLGTGSYDTFSAVPSDVLLKDWSGTYAEGPLGNITQLVAGAEHTCALLQGGTVKCWGGNFHGQRGVVPAGVTNSLPDLQGLPGPAKAITAGSIHNCALLETGSVWCWGWNKFANELGIPTVNDKEPPVVTIPAPATGAPGVVSVTAGQQHTCAMLADGEVRCWGANGKGQLGINTFTDKESPVTVTSLGLGATGSAVKALGLGGATTCAITEDGKLRCWGANGSGQVGDGTLLDKKEPTAVPGLGGGQPGSSVKALGLGGLMTCAITGDGTLRCWGENASGQLGDGTTASRGTPEVVSLPCVNGYHPGGDGLCIAKGMCAAGYHDDGVGNCVTTGCAAGYHDGGNGACVLLGVCVTGYHDDGAGACVASGCTTGFHDGGDGTCLASTDCLPGYYLNLSGACFAPNCTSGQHDDGTGNCVATGCAAGFHDLSGVCVADVERLAAGSDWACALDKAGAVKCWGRNQKGQLGRGGSPNQPTNSGTAAPVKTPSGKSLAGVKVLSVGSNHACAVMRADGSVRCWGDNAAGQLGDGTTDTRTVATPVPRVTGAVDVAAGRSHTCALMGTGAVSCWGANNWGMLGKDPTVVASSVVPVEALAAPVGAAAKATGLFATAYNTCALLSNSKVACWGWSTNGEMGDGTKVAKYAATSVLDPAGSVELGGVTALSTGADTYHRCAVGPGGKLWCWGWNSFWQLGQGASSQDDKTLPVEVMLGSGVQSVAAGFRHTCAVLTTGGVKCWGQNNYGVIGNGTYTNDPGGPFNDAPAPETVMADATTPLTGASSVTAGEYFTCVLMGTGAEARCWGNNYSNQLGSQPANSFYPSKVNGL